LTARVHLKITTMLPTADELLKENLTGYCYFEEYTTMSRTSRYSIEYEPYVVLSDNGTDCIVKRMESEYKTTIRKEYLANLIALNPMLSGGPERTIKRIDI